MRYKYDFAKVMNRTMKMLENSELIKHVQKMESSHECFMTIHMSSEGAVQKEKVLALAQKTLLDGAVPSKMDKNHKKRSMMRKSVGDAKV